MQTSDPVAHDDHVPAEAVDGYGTAGAIDGHEADRIAPLHTASHHPAQQPTQAKATPYRRPESIGREGARIYDEARSDSFSLPKDICPMPTSHGSGDDDAPPPEAVDSHDAAAVATPAHAAPVDDSRVSYVNVPPAALHEFSDEAAESTDSHEAADTVSNHEDLHATAPTDVAPGDNNGVGYVNVPPTAPLSGENDVQSGADVVALDGRTLPGAHVVDTTATGAVDSHETADAVGSHGDNREVDGGHDGGCNSHSNETAEARSVVRSTASVAAPEHEGSVEVGGSATDSALELATDQSAERQKHSRDGGSPRSDAVLHYLQD